MANGFNALPTPDVPDIPLGLPVADRPPPLALDMGGLVEVPEPPEDELFFPPAFVGFDAPVDAPLLLPPPGVARLAPDAPDLLADAVVGEADEPPDLLGVPGLAPAQVAPDLLAPTLAETGGLIAPPPLSALDSSLAGVSQLSNQDQDLRRTANEVQLALATEQDPTKRAALQAQLVDADAALRQTQGELGQARAIADEEQAVESQRVEDDLRLRQRDAVLDIRTEQQEQAVLDQAADARLAERAEVARADQRKATERFGELVRRGPPTIAIALAAVTEALDAFNDDRQPNFASAFNTFVEQHKALTQPEIDAQKARVELLGDDVRDIARQEQEAKIQRASRDAAIANSVMLDLDREIAGAQDDQTRAAATRARDNFRALRDSRNAEAEAERAKRARADTSADIKDQLAQSKIGTEQARAAKLAAETAKLQRRGSGRGGRSKALALGEFPPELRALAASGKEGRASAQRQFQRWVIDPVTGKAQRRADGTFAIATTPAIAQSLNVAGPRASRINRLVNEAMAIRGKEGWEPTGAFFGTAAGQRMAAISSELLLINKDIFGLGVLSGADEKLLLTVQGGQLQGLRDPRPAMTAMRRRMIRDFNENRKSLAPGALPLTFPRTSAAPKRTIANVTTLLTQAPGRDGDVPSARSRLAGSDELFELSVRRNDGDIEKASADFEKQGKTILRKNQAHRDDLQAEWERERPANWDVLQAELGAAGAARFLLPDDADGATINAADRRLARAAQTARSSQTTRSRKLKAGLDEQEQFIDGFGNKLAGEARKRAQSKQLKREAVERAEDRVEEFAAGDIPTGARGAF